MHASGVGPVAITTLEMAVETASDQGHRTVTDADIEDAIPDAEAELRHRSLDKLSRHQRAVSDIVDQCGPVQMEEFHQRYREGVENPRRNG